MIGKNMVAMFLQSQIDLILKNEKIMNIIFD